MHPRRAGGHVRGGLPPVVRSGRAHFSSPLLTDGGGCSTLRPGGILTVPRKTDCGPLARGVRSSAAGEGRTRTPSSRERTDGGEMAATVSCPRCGLALAVDERSLGGVAVC